jgi:hypothetical protein
MRAARESSLNFEDVVHFRCCPATLPSAVEWAADKRMTSASSYMREAPHRSPSRLCGNGRRRPGPRFWKALADRGRPCSDHVCARGAYLRWVQPAQPCRRPPSRSSMPKPAPRSWMSAKSGKFEPAARRSCPDTATGRRRPPRRCAMVSSIRVTSANSMRTGSLTRYCEYGGHRTNLLISNAPHCFLW